VSTTEARLVISELISHNLFHLVDTFLALVTNWSSTSTLSHTYKHHAKYAAALFHITCNTHMSLTECHFHYDVTFKHSQAIRLYLQYSVLLNGLTT